MMVLVGGDTWLKINGKRQLSGAQPPSTFLKVFDLVADANSNA